MGASGFQLPSNTVEGAYSVYEQMVFSVVEDKKFSIII